MHAFFITANKTTKLECIRIPEKGELIKFTLDKNIYEVDSVSWKESGDFLNALVRLIKVGKI